MNSEYDFPGLEPVDGDSENRTVYVRAVDVADLPDEMQDAAGDVEHLYAVCTEEGEQLALVNERRLAFVLAREHDYAPVSVH